jgi:hypothetical protein
MLGIDQHREISVKLRLLVKVSVTLWRGLDLLFGGACFEVAFLGISWREAISR